jgi:hypothetical protein
MKEEPRKDSLSQEFQRDPKINQKTSEGEVKARSEVFHLCGVVTVTFRVLSLFVVTECYNQL